MSTALVERAGISAHGLRFDLEYRWIEPRRRDRPLLVFLHEGLGSVAMWRDFPDRLCAGAACRGLVYSRRGYGQSTPRPPGERWPVDFMHREAGEVLPALLHALDLQEERPLLFGHSDGGSIALLYAAMYPEKTAGIVVAAPHIFVEDVTLANIEAARAATCEPTCGSGWRAITPTRTPPSGAGTRSGWTRPSRDGTSRTTCPACAARRWPCRASTTSTAPWPR